MLALWPDIMVVGDALSESFQEPETETPHIQFSLSDSIFCLANWMDETLLLEEQQLEPSQSVGENMQYLGAKWGSITITIRKWGGWPRETHS